MAITVQQQPYDSHPAGSDEHTLASTAHIYHNWGLPLLQYDDVELATSVNPIFAPMIAHFSEFLTSTNYEVFPKVEEPDCILLMIKPFPMELVSNLQSVAGKVLADLECDWRIEYLWMGYVMLIQIKTLHLKPRNIIRSGVCRQMVLGIAGAMPEDGDDDNENDKEHLSLLSQVRPSGKGMITKALHRSLSEPFGLPSYQPEFCFIFTKPDPAEMTYLPLLNAPDLMTFIVEVAIFSPVHIEDEARKHLTEHPLEVNTVLLITTNGEACTRAWVKLLGRACTDTDPRNLGEIITYLDWTEFLCDEEGATVDPSKVVKGDGLPIYLSDLCPRGTKLPVEHQRPLPSAVGGQEAPASPTIEVSWEGLRADVRRAREAAQNRKRRHNSLEESGDRDEWVGRTAKRLATDPVE